MTDPLVSIVTPSYNSGKTIENAILSVKNQRYPHIEHIIMDGGSTDETLEVVRRYENTYSMRWVSEPDRGMYDALNKGFRLARGAVFAELDCDDLYLPWSVQTAVHALCKHSLIFGDWLAVDPERGAVNLESRLPFISSYYRADGIIAQPTVFWRREVMEQVGGFDESFKLLADVEYWLRMEKAGFRPTKIPEVLAIESKRSNSQSLTPRNRDLLRHEMMEIRRRYSSRLPRILWHLVRPVPLVNRIQLFCYWAKMPFLWPALRDSCAVSFGLRDLFDAIFLGNRKSSLIVDWQKILPVGVDLLPKIALGDAKGRTQRKQSWPA